MTDFIDSGARLALAAHLVQCGLRGTASPRSDVRYRQAIALWEASAGFRAEAEAVASGLGLAIADVNDRGIALMVRDGSIFVPSPAQVHGIYANGTTSKERQTAAEARAVLCAAITVTAAMAYPDAHAIDGLTPSTPIFAKEVREKLVALAEREGDRAEGPADGEPQGLGGMPALWDAVLRCAPIVTTQTGRHKEGTLGWHVQKAFELLAENGHADLRRPGEEGEGELGLHILPKDRFRKLVRHSATAAHAAIREAMGRLGAAHAAPATEAA